MDTHFVGCVIVIEVPFFHAFVSGSKTSNETEGHNDSKNPIFWILKSRSYFRQDVKHNNVRAGDRISEKVFHRLGVDN